MIRRLCVVAFLIGLSIVGDAGAAQYYGRSGTPFGTIAALMGWPDIQTVGAREITDIRVSSWFGKDPAALIRLVQAKDSLRTEFILWWPSLNSIQLQSSWPSGPDVRCDAPKEGPRTCVKVVTVDLKQDWGALFRDLRLADKCGSGKLLSTPTHTEEMQLQVSDKGGFRALRCGQTDGPAGPVVNRTLRLLRDIAAQAGY